MQLQVGQRTNSSHSMYLCWRGKESLGKREENPHHYLRSLQSQSDTPSYHFPVMRAGNRGTREEQSVDMGDILMSNNGIPKRLGTCN